LISYEFHVSLNTKQGITPREEEWYSSDYFDYFQWLYTDQHV